MQLNVDYAKRVALDTAALPWQLSPAPGVERKLLERDGEELARATSLVRYVPGARFASHRHDAGEEIFVLQGTFADEAGSYAAGTYLKNPPGSAHAPRSPEGCVLFVKLRYQAPDDSARIVIDTTEAAWQPGLVEGLTVLPLASYAAQHTALVRWAPGTVFTPHRHYGGEEIFVLDGVFEDEYGRYPAGSWLRSPHLSQHRPFSREGCTILVKTGHLPATAHAA